ncbi:semaphorin-5A-like [Pollicipes pollicipes]|uniref:semaphorin-5A-like n=1 Tax=Pollicipes pollicipes TaxID=41117 RepID=UPI001884BC69|nr:semaphorin-5A-like [Pollicipes pollicipes]
MCHSNPPCPTETTLPVDGGWGDGRQQRFRFECAAPVAEPGLIRVSSVRLDERHCDADGRCSPANWTGLGWGDWSPWSECSVPCGGGVQTKSRTCDGDSAACLGPSRVEQECNVQRCKGDWSCWSEWSACSVSCGVGRRRRDRECRATAAAGSADVICDGAATSEEPCEMTSCTSLEGWNQWSVWSLCDARGEQHRARHCMVSEPGGELCQGEDRQARLCVDTGDAE